MRWSLLEPYGISTSKFHNEFHKAPRNMKQLGLDAISLSFTKNVLQKFQDVLPPQNSILGLT